MRTAKTNGLIFMSIFALIVVMLSSVSAWTSDKFVEDTDKIRELDTTTKYGTYEIIDHKWWDILKVFTEEKVKEVELIENTPECSNDCLAIVDIELIKDGTLVEEVLFKRDFGKGWVDWNQFNNWRIYVEQDVEQFETICKDGKEIIDEKNGTSYFEQDCSQNSLGYVKQWNTLDLGKTYSSGSYKVKLEGGKKEDTHLDWIFKTSGVLLSEWATWGRVNASLGDGLVAQYRLNTYPNQTDVRDTLETNNGVLVGKTFNDGTVSGGVTIEDGAMKFDGVDAKVGNNTISSQIDTSNSFSFATWVKIDSIPPSGTSKNVISFLYSGTNLKGTGIQVTNNSNIPRFDFSTRNDSVQKSTSSTSISYLNNWVFVSGTYDNINNNQSIYVNGNLIKSDIGAEYTNSTRGIRIGGNDVISGLPSYFNGSIDQVTIFNRSLRSSEIAGLYAQGRNQYSNITTGLVAQYSGRDYSGTAGTPTTIQDTNHLSQGKINQAFNFDGVNDYVNTTTISNSNFNGTDGFTISAWVNALNFGANNNGRIINKGSGTSATDGTSFQISSTSNRLSLNVNGSSSNSETNSFTSEMFNSWQHVSVIVSQNGSVSFYVNGNTKNGVGSDLVSASTTNITSLGSLMIGNNYNLIRGFNGSIDDVRIYNRSLSETEILNIYNEGLGTEGVASAWVELQSPANGSIAYTADNDFIASAEVEGGAYLTNMSFCSNITGSWGCGDSVSFNTITNIVDNFDALNNTAWDFGGQCSVSSGILDCGSPSQKYSFPYKFSSFDSANNQINITTRAKSSGTNPQVELFINRQSNTAGGFGQGYMLAIANGVMEIYEDGSSVLASQAGSYDINNYHVYSFVMLQNGTMRGYRDGALIVSATDTTYTSGYVGFANENFDKTMQLDYVDITITPSFATSSIQTWSKTIPAGSTLWNVRACDSDGDCGFSVANYTVSLDNSAPTITILGGSGIQNYGTLTQNHTITYFVNDTNLASCWIEYNGTNRTDNCVNAVPKYYNFTMVKDLYNLKVWANDTAGNVQSQVVSWNYKVFESVFIYNNETRAGDQEDFSLQLILHPDYDLTSATFHYDGLTASPSIFSSGNNRTLNITNYAVPTYTVDTNVSIWFDLVLDDATAIETQNYTQLVQAIFLDNCSTYTNVMFNISLFDEVEQTPLNGDIEFYYNLLNVPAYQTISSANLSLTNRSNYAICSDVNLTDQNYVQSIEIRYVADGYVPELYHIQRAEITPEVRNIDLYDLNASDSTEFKLTYQDDSFNFVEGAVIQLMRRYISEDAYKVVEAPLTSSEGIAVAHIDLDSIKYKATVVKNGEVLDTFENLVFKCQSELTGECELKLLGNINPQNSINYDTERDFTYAITPGDNNISITYSIPSSNPSSVNIVLTQKDQWGNTTSCNKTVLSSGGSIECDYDETLGISYLQLEINKDGVPIAYNTYVIDEDTGMDFLDNNYIIVVVLLLSLVGMALASPEWIVINGILTMLLAGMLWLVNGIEFVTGLGLLMWLVIAAGILILKLSKQEDK
jgi:hypothetical protein